MTELLVSTTGPRGFAAQVMIDAHRAATRDVEVLLRETARAQADRTRAGVPKKTGVGAASVKGTVKRTANGYVLRIAPGKGATQIRAGGASSSHDEYDTEYRLYFVEKGTGERGPLHRTIPPSRRGLIPSGSGRRVPTGIGQAPVGMFAKARHAYDTGTALVLDRRIQDLLDAAVTAAIAKAGRV